MIKKLALLLALTLSINTFAYLPDSECSKRWDKILETHNTNPDLTHKCDRSLKEEIKHIISTNIDLGYRKARHYMFSEIDNVNGVVCSVYSTDCIRTNGIPDHRIMNCEHSFPQSKGAKGIAKSDLHHLYPVMSKMNSRRSNYPLCEVSSVIYEKDGSSLGYSKYGTLCFEPRDQHKGDVARSMLYFAIRYKFNLDKEQESFFRKWNKEDGVSEKEIKRNDDIESVQYNRNILVDYPYLIDLMSDI